ncbi:MAG: protein translocase subunit SecD [Pseudomonadota bacterium]
MLYFARWKIILISAVCLVGVLFALPNILPQSVRSGLPTFVPHKTVNLGLDLQGGAHLLLQLNVEELYTERLKNLLVDLRDPLLRPVDGGARINSRRALSPDGEAVIVTLRTEEDMSRAITAIRGLAQPVGGAFGAPGFARDLSVNRVDEKRIRVTVTEEAKEASRRAAIAQSISVFERRLNEFGTTEPTITSQGDSRVLIQFPGITNVEDLKRLLGTAAKLTFHLVNPDIAIPPALSGLSAEEVGDQFPVPTTTEWVPSRSEFEDFVPILSKVEISGENLRDARGGLDPRTNEPAVFLSLDTKGARQFGRITAENVNRRFAIILDGEALTAPVINEPIPSGNAVISGNFTLQSANDLSILLRSGSLPTSMQIIEERTVGPGMGADSIAAGQTAAIIGLIAVIIFIAIYYGLFGLFANVALLINLTLILGALSVLQATLTLPGIAGIVLTVGMAVDANVLIFERIREEVRTGKSPLNAVEAGYSRALGTILDANITTFIAAFILFMLGSGPVKGFAVTLAIGIMTSVFTAFTLTRFFVVLWLRRARPAALPI